MNLFDQKKLLEWGIVDFGYTTEMSPKSIDHYNNWIDDKKYLPLDYLTGLRKEKRQSLKEYWPESESALVFLFSYKDAHLKLQSFYDNNKSWNGLKIASYVLGFEGLDYHEWIKCKLIEIGDDLKNSYDKLEYKLILDTQPVLERDLALRAGLGWFGKNSMLINRHHGSFFIIGSLLLNKKIAEESERKIETDHCGQCTLCADACPTKAIDPVSRTITAIDCISTYTIEQFKENSVSGKNMTLKKGYIFGCDICQDVCPWNKRLDRQFKNNTPQFTYENQNKIVEFFLKKEVTFLKKELSLLSEGRFRKLFGKTSFARSGKRGLYKNVIFYLRELNIIS